MFGVVDNSGENEKAIERFKDAKRTGMIRPHQYVGDAKTPDSIKAYLDKLSGPRRFSEGQITRNQGVNQCRFGSGGMTVMGPNGTPCGYGIQVPAEMSGLVDATNYKKNDVIVFKVNLIIPAGIPVTANNIGGYKKVAETGRELGMWDQISQIESLGDDFYFTEGGIEGVIEEVYPNSALLGGEGVVYKVIPMATRLTKDAQEDFTKPMDDQKDARDSLMKNTDIRNVGLLNKHVVENYIPLKIGKLPIVYWVGVYNDLQTAQVVVTTSYVTYKQLEENLYTQSERVILGAYPLTEIILQKHRTFKPSSSRIRS